MSPDSGAPPFLRPRLDLSSALQERNRDLRRQAVVTAVEAAIGAGTFMLTDVLGASPEARMMALHYLHGGGPMGSWLPRRQRLTIEVEVTAKVIKHNVRSVVTPEGRERTVEDAPLKYEPGRCRLDTSAATWLLWHHGDTARMAQWDEARRSNDIKCREVPPGEGEPPASDDALARRVNRRGS